MVTRWGLPTPSARRWSTSSRSARATTPGTIMPTTSPRSTVRRWATRHRSTISRPIRDFSWPTRTRRGPGSRRAARISRSASRISALAAASCPMRPASSRPLQRTMPLHQLERHLQLQRHPQQGVGQAQPQGRALLRADRQSGTESGHRSGLLPGRLQLRQHHGHAEQHAGRVRQRLPGEFQQLHRRRADCRRLLVHGYRGLRAG